MTIRAYADRIVVIHAEETVADHPRCFDKGRTIYNPWHYLGVLERKPGALRHGAPFRDWDLPEHLNRMRSRLERRLGGDREFVALLSAVCVHGLDQIDAACAWALEQGVVQSEVIVNHLSRVEQAPDPEPVPIPPGLALTQEPTDDCSKYDCFLGNGHATS